MHSRESIPHATLPAAPNLPKLLCALLLPLIAACIPTPLHAQDAPPPPQQPLYTLHLDTRMAQIPTLMLNYGAQPIPLFEPQRVDITIDSGHKFHPSHVRFEGDDPITLAVLIDVSSKESDLLRAFSKDLSPWITSALKPQDRVSIYAVDCGLLQTANYQPPLPSPLQRDLDAAIISPLTHGKKTRPACGSSVRLRGSMDVIMNQLAPLPGRHVLLVLSSGYDGGSIESWEELWDDATGSATTVFGISEPGLALYGAGIPLDEFTRNTGGLVFRPSSKLLPEVLNGFISILRHRQILEFPIPLQVFGNHIIDVSIEHTNVEALPSGIPIVPIPEAPPTVPVSPQAAPPAPNPKPPPSPPPSTSPPAATPASPAPAAYPPG